MPNQAYLRGRRLEWAIQKLFREAGYTAMRTAGSHGVADVVVCQTADDPLAFMQPLPSIEIQNVLGEWDDIDAEDVLSPFLYGKVKSLSRGGEQRIYLTPAQCWLLQLKSKKG